MKKGYELERMMIPVDKDKKVVVHSELGAKRKKPKWAQAAVAGTGALIGLLMLEASTHKSHNARRSEPGPAATAQPHRTSETPTTVPETTTTPARRQPSAADIGQRFAFKFIHDGYTGTCEAERIVTVHTSKDAMEIVATEGMSSDWPENYLMGHVVGANYDFNRQENGIQIDDYANMKPGDKYTKVGNCILRSPTYSNTDGSTSIWVEQQSSDATFFFDAKTSRLTGCDPEPACEKSTPPQIPNR